MVSSIMHPFQNSSKVKRSDLHSGSVFHGTLASRRCACIKCAFCGAAPGANLATVGNAMRYSFQRYGNHQRKIGRARLSSETFKPGSRLGVIPEGGALGNTRLFLCRKVRREERVSRNSLMRHLTQRNRFRWRRSSYAPPMSSTNYQRGRTVRPATRAPLMRARARLRNESSPRRPFADNPGYRHETPAG